MKFKNTLMVLVLFVALGCVPGTDTAHDASNTSVDVQNATEDTFPVYLPSINGSGVAETIWIPNGRPIYALLVSGFHQNRNLNMFHFYNFAKCLLGRGAYVHYAWWNNLLAPYMEKPLHDENSVPSTGALPVDDMLNLLPFPALEAKAVPNDDIQFQADARALLTAIREKNPDAAIILVGHSMGGDSVARLADSVDSDIDIALLAPIDPVGNRSCVRYFSPDSPYVWLPLCNGLFNFTRWRATHLEWLTTKFTFNPWEFDPPQRAFTDRVQYLYHRWQQEFAPPFDFACPPGSRYWECDSGRSYEEYLFVHPDTHVYTIQQALEQGSANVQSEYLTDLLSHYDAPRYEGDDLTGELDGHGEIVGFRGVKPWSNDSYPLALDAKEYWPSLDIERSFDDEDDRADVRNFRMFLLKEWEKDPSYLDEDWGPANPEYCMVSGDLCEILRTAINAAPVADAGPDQTVECGGPDGTPVILDGSGSSDPNEDPLSYTWTGPFGTLTGEVVTADLPLGTHTITLTVDDGRGLTDSDTVEITVVDSVPPEIDLSITPDLLWPPNHKLVDVSAFLEITDACDASPAVELVSITSSEADNGRGDGHTSNDIQGANYGSDDRVFSLRSERSGNYGGRIYTVTYRGTDGSGNTASASAEVTAPHNR